MVDRKNREVNANKARIADLRRRIEVSDIDLVTQCRNELKSVKDQLKAHL